MALETFINGIEVLDKTEIKEPIPMLIFFIVIVFVLMGFLEIRNDVDEFFVLLSCIGLFIVGSIICGCIQKPTGEYEYKVTIDDTVSLNEFMEKYEITDQEGKIYTIRLKESE